MDKIIILIPIYKAVLDPLERYSLDHSLSVLTDRRIQFIGPESLSLDYYSAHYPAIPCKAYDDAFFLSVAGYSRLLLNPDFYAAYSEYEFLLILQTDAVILQDELTFWCAQPFDYIGAPWPNGYELFVNAGVFEGDYGKQVKVYVGNGGLSLRRISKCIALLQEFSVIVDVFQRGGSSEDLFFSVMGALSVDFILPNEIIASRFSLELQPAYYFGVNGGKLPMGGHAWWKYEPDFWRKILIDAPIISQI